MLCRGDAGAGNLITFVQFLFVAIEGLFTHVERVPPTTNRKPFFPYRIVPRKIPLIHYVVSIAHQVYVQTYIG